jgi:hypothetical protein
MVPPQRAPFDDRTGERTKGSDRGDLSRQIDFSVRRSRRLAGEAPGQPQASKADREIDEKDRAPADQRNQRAAGKRACCQR